MRTTSHATLVVVACLVLGSAAHPQQPEQPDTTDKALEDIGDWLKSRLPRYGRFYINVTADWSHARAMVGDNRSAEVRHQVRDVSFENCELQYTVNLFLPGTAGPGRWEVTVPLRSVDIREVRVQMYELPVQLRATNQRYQVYVKAAATEPGFIVIDTDDVRREVWEYQIPVDRDRNAEQVAETLRHAARLCGAR